jgi:hypothetical protein
LLAGLEWAASGAQVLMPVGSRLFAVGRHMRSAPRTAVCQEAASDADTWMQSVVDTSAAFRSKLA